jgi:hypothetical protein
MTESYSLDIAGYAFDSDFCLEHVIDEPPDILRAG